MKRTSYILALLAGASALLLSGCTKQSGDGLDAPLSFSANVPEIVETKAEVVSSVTDFYITGYTGTTKWFPKTGTSAHVTLSGGSATFDSYRWKTNEIKTFFAYSNNLPDGATASIASSGVTLTYSAIPTDATNQADVLLGRYSGDGDNKGEAALTFYHPLAQVVFKMGDMVGVSKIDKIEIQGVYNAGSTTLSTSTATSGSPAVANFSWTDLGGSEKVSQTVTGSLPTTGAEIGVPFMLIPQNFATQSITISVTATVGGATKTLTTVLSSGSLATGKASVCTLNYDPYLSLTATLSAYTVIDGSGTSSTGQLGSYTSDDETDIFESDGPDPRYWVDLGIVSKNGYPLYISRRNVKKIENGIAYFTDSEDELVTFTISNFPSGTEFTSEDGLPCRYLSGDSMNTLYSTDYFDIVKSDQKWVFTRKGSEKYVNFLFNDSYYYYFDYSIGFYKNVFCGTEFAFYEGYYSDTYAFKLEYEDTSADKIEFGDNFKLYFQNGSWDYMDDFSKLNTPIQNGQALNWQSYAGSFVLEPSCPDGYILKSFTLLPGFEWSGPSDIFPPFCMDRPNFGSYSVTKGSTVLSFTISN